MSKKHITLPETALKDPKADYITADDVIESSAKSLSDMIAEAKAKALKAGIKANTVIIDEHFAKVNAFDFVFGRGVMRLPPMICGLEVQVSDEFPDGYDFIVLEAPETERERLIARAKLETAREIFAEIESCLDYIEEQLDDIPDAFLCVKDDIAELKKKYTEVDNESQSS